MAEHTAHDINFRSAKFEAAYGTAKQLPPSTRPEVTFAGRSNVGKSSLLNRLFERKQLAKVSSRPGKTATINFYDVDGLHLVDLPGYGYARVSHAERARWDELIGGYFDQERSFNLVCALVDIRHEAQKLDVQMVEFLKEGGFPFIALAARRHCPPARDSCKPDHRNLERQGHGHRRAARPHCRRLPRGR